MNEIKIIPAAIIRDSIKPKERDYDSTRESLNKKIQENKYRGNLIVMTLPDVIVNELVSAGYNVRFHRALHMGDVDTHEIIWRC